MVAFYELLSVSAQVLFRELAAVGDVGGDESHFGGEVFDDLRVGLVGGDGVDRADLELYFEGSALDDIDDSLIEIFPHGCRVALFCFEQGFDCFGLLFCTVDVDSVVEFFLADPSFELFDVGDEAIEGDEEAEHRADQFLFQVIIGRNDL
jgi:hypothetical protein